MKKEIDLSIIQQLKKTLQQLLIDSQQHSAAIKQLQKELSQLKTQKANKRQNDLKTLEGVNSKTKQALTAAGLENWRQSAEALAEAGKFEELKALQERLPEVKYYTK